MWVTELPLEVAGLVFDRLAAKDLISLRLVDQATCVYVAAYWEQIKPLYRQRQTELVVQITDGQDVERFVQGRTNCVSKWRLQEPLFIASCNITASNVVPTPVLKSVKSLRLNGKRRSFSQLQQAAAANGADCVSWSGLLGNAECLAALQRLELTNVTEQQLEDLGPPSALSRLADRLAHLCVRVVGHYGNAPVIGQSIAGLFGAASTLRGLESLEITTYADHPGAGQEGCWEGIFKLTSLTRLALNGHTRTSRIPDSISVLDRVHSLALDDMRALRLLPDTIAGMANLRRLSLDRCSAVNTHVLRTLTQLEHLSVRDSLHNQDFSSWIANLTGLTSLDISDNRCAHFDCYAILGRLSRLVRLSMENMELGRVPESVVVLTNLEYLYMANNFITRLPPRIYDLKKLKLLDVSESNAHGPKPLDSADDVMMMRNRGVRVYT